MSGHSTPTLASLLVRSNNPKDHKDKRNMERLLAGSEFSLAGPDHDLELDYYDYNVSNAGAVPGSFLGMDPAYLVWIPPFAPGYWEEESDQLLSQTEVLSQSDITSQEIPTEGAAELNFQQVTEFVPRSLLPNDIADVAKEDNKLSQEHINGADDTKTRKGKNKTRKDRETEEINSQKLDHSAEGNQSYPLNNLHKEISEVPESPVRVHGKPTEKETRVEKSPSENNSDFCDFLDVEDDIKFADDEDEDECNNCDNVIITEPKKSCHIKV